MLRAALLLVAAPLMLPAPSPPPRDDRAVARAFAAYKFAGPFPAPLREAREDWAGAKARAAEPRFAAWLAGVRTRTLGWRTRYGDRAGWVAGWAHDLVDPKSGAPLVWRWETPEPAAGTKLRGAWVYYVRQSNVRTLHDAARLWRLSGGAADRDWAAAQLDLYADAYARWPVQTLNGRSQLFGQSLDEAVAATELIDAARLLAPAVGAKRAERWNDGLFRPMLRNLQASNRGANNIAVWQAAACAVLALQLGDDAAYRRAIDEAGGIRDMLARGVTADDLWFEPSLAYGAYTMRALGTVFTAASLAGRAAPLRSQMLRAQSVIASQMAMRFADDTLPAMGDSSPGMPAFDPEGLALTQRTMPVRAGALPPSWATLLDPGLPVAPPPAETGSRLWRDSQVAMLRRGGWELFVHWGQRSDSHAQADALSWELRHGARAIVDPAGTAAYGSPLFLDYLRRSPAHAMPLVDGEGQVSFGPGTLLAATGDGVTVSHPGFRAATVTRTVSLDAAGMIERTVFRSAGDAPRRLGEVFSTACRVTPATATTAASTPAGTGLGWWRDVRVSAPTPTWEAVLDCDGVGFRLRLAGDVPGRVFIAAAPDRTGAYTRTAVYFEATAPALTLALRIGRG